MGRLNGGDDPLGAGQVLEGLHRLLVGDGDILGPSRVVEVGVLRADARVVQPGGQGVHRGDLPVLVLAEVGLHAVENSQPAGGDGGGGLPVSPPSGNLTADEADGGIPNKVVKL